MIECRDWPATLWQASYMGVPFYFENDDSEGGRSLAIHEYPNADDPYIEDLGRKTRLFSGTAYVHGDDADIQALDLENIFETQGPGTLVLPIAGPVQVHCDTFTRKFEKDKLGYIAFTVKFVRAGAPAALVSVPLLGQQVFDGADGLSFSLASVFPDALDLENTADYVLAAAIDTVAGVATTIELIRTANPVDPAISAQVARATNAIAIAAPLLIAPAGDVDPDDVANLLNASPDLDTTFTDPSATLAAVVIATIRLLGDGMQGNVDAGAGALLSLALDYPPSVPGPVLSANASAAASNAAAIASLARVAALLAWCEALERQSYNSRPDGIAARAAAAERLGNELDNWGGAANFGVYVSLQDLQGAVAQYLTALIANLAPVVTVSAPQSMPALWWAHRLYSDPNRAVDLALRNQVRHPSFMPLQFQALAPDFTAPSSLPVVWPAP